MSRKKGVILMSPEKKEKMVIDAVEVYLRVKHLIGIENIDGELFTKQSLVRWSINPRRKFICIFCGNVSSDDHVCSVCKEYKGLLPLVTGGEE